MSEEKPQSPKSETAERPIVKSPRGKPVAKRRKTAASPLKATGKRHASKAQKKRTVKGSLYTKDEIHTIFERFYAADPTPKGELDHSNPFTLVVAVALSAQATDVGVNKATRELFRLADTPQKMVALGEYRVSDLIKTIGLFRTKAKNVVALSQMLLDEFGGEVPANRDQLMRLPGVGQKTANVVMNIAFGEAEIAVDTHIFRLANRLGLAPGRTPAIVERELHKVIPAEFKRDSHHWLILHGRYVCKARVPDCSHCIIADLCKYPEKTSDVAFPITPK
jgi:endonuclease-3